MAEKKKNSKLGVGYDLAEKFISKSGLEVNVTNDVWVLLPDTRAKGGLINVGWIKQLNLGQDIRFAILETLVYYGEQRSAATLTTVNYALIDTLPGLHSLEEFKSIWSSVADAKKKTLKGFFSTGAKLNSEIFGDWSSFTANFNYAAKSSILDPNKGRLTDYEYDSFLADLRLKCDRIKVIDIERCDDQFFRKIASAYHYDFDNKISFGAVSSTIGFRLLTQLVRRPAQIVSIKWCDIIPVGSSFTDDNVSMEPMLIDRAALHIRIFKIKQNFDRYAFRQWPEKSSIYLSEDICELLHAYKRIYLHGLNMALENSGINLSGEEYGQLVSSLPVLPNSDLFTAELSPEVIRELIDNKMGQLFHSNAGSLVSAIRKLGKSKSDRFSDVIVSNNRIRHTVLSNAAMSGYSIERIAKITDVTVNAARAYLDLGIKERQKINENYQGNSILEKAFMPISDFADKEELIASIELGVVGVGDNPSDCNSCSHKKRLQRPVPCYGCENFVPFLEGDHAGVLTAVRRKIAVLKSSALGGVESGVLKRLKKAERYIGITIDVCDQIVKSKKSVEDQNNRSVKA
jgi:hypothetical protein